MSLQPRLTQRQTQQLTMTPQLQQAIRLLQMSSVELQQFIDEELETNPLLEQISVEDPETVSDPAPEQSNDPVSPEPAELQSTVPGSNEFSRATEFLASSTSLKSYLRDQISLAKEDERVSALAQILTDELDDDGYLRTPLEDIADRLGIEEYELEEPLRLLQSCDPTGVGARSLSECFTLQLAEKDELTPEIQALLDRFELGAGVTDRRIWSTIGIDPKEHAGLLEQIRCLNPAPGKMFDQGTIQYAVPDVSVFRNNLGGWSVELIASTQPAIAIKSDYAKEVASKGEDAAEFVDNCTSRANWLIRSVHQRSSTILKVAAEIVRVQENFFSLGLSELKPLTMRDVAEELKIHESTVSRITNDKYLMCERGTFELRFFFSKALKSTGKGDQQSSHSVQKMIKTMIDLEHPKKVLSDDNIVQLLKEKGVDIARRTVSKYREAMNIPSSIERRRFKSSASKNQSRPNVI